MGAMDHHHDSAPVAGPWAGGWLVAALAGAFAAALGGWLGDLGTPGLVLTAGGVFLVFGVLLGSGGVELTLSEGHDHDHGHGHH
jgi:hypothetical protein